MKNRHDAARRHLEELAGIVVSKIRRTVEVAVPGLEKACRNARRVLERIESGQGAPKRDPEDRRRGIGTLIHSHISARRRSVEISIGGLNETRLRRCAGYGPVEHLKGCRRSSGRQSEDRPMAEV